MNSRNATGITLRSVFGQIDKSRLAEVFWASGTNREFIDIPYVKLDYSKLSAGKILSRFSRGSVNAAIKKNNDVQAKRNKLPEYVRQFFACMMDASRIDLNREMIGKISEYKPDVIYTLGASVNSLKTSYILSKELSVPIVIHYMDNWLFHLQWEKNPLLYFYKKKLRKYARLCRERGNCGICISEGMAKEYTDFTGKKHTAIMNSIDTKKFLCEKVPYRVPVRFCYAGGLHLGRDKMLLKIARALGEVSDLIKKPCEMVIYTGKDNIERYKGEFGRVNIKWCEAVPHERITEVYNGADVLIHTEVLNGDMNEFIKYSVSTKISEYLSTGKPILFLGPESIYLYKLLSEKDMAFTACDDETLKEALVKILRCDDVFTKTQNALNFVKENFDICVSAERFNKTVESARL